MMNTTAAIVSGAIFGSIFVLTCIISAVKAVRDRKRIKERIAEKERVKQQKQSSPRQNGVSIEEITCPRDDQRARRLAQLQTGDREHVPAEPPEQSGEGRHSWDGDKNGSCSYQEGVDNLTYAHSNFDIKDKPGALQLPQSNIITADISPAKSYTLTKRSHSACAIERKQQHINNLSPECLAVKKLLRRHSYETAVCENSWLPTELPTFASSEAIVNTYNYGGRNISKSSVGFENRAYNRDERF